MTSFSIGSQNAGVINNVAGDQRITGGQHGTQVTLDTARQAVRDLHAGLSATALDGKTAAEARTQVETIDAELEAPQPDRSRVARSVERLTRLLAAARSLATAGAALMGPLRLLAGWLGTLGEPILRLLPIPG
jgi:hypothetical protein